MSLAVYIPVQIHGIFLSFSFNICVSTLDDEVSQASGDPSETSSVTYSMDDDDVLLGGEGGEGLDHVDVDKIRAQLAVSGSQQACKEIR